MDELERKIIEEYNSLPFNILKLNAILEVRTRIQHLLFEKDRLTRRYKESLKQINSHIKNCEQGIKEEITQYYQDKD